MSDPIKLVCPMPGQIVRVLVTEKSEVEAKQGVVVVEAMKMQNEIKSLKRGKLQKVGGCGGERECGRCAGGGGVKPNVSHDRFLSRCE